MKKILIIRLSSLGDVVLASSVIEPLYNAGFEIDFLTFKPFDELFIKDYRVNKVIAVSKENLKSIKDIYNFSKSLKYDYILDIHFNFRSVLISLFAKGKVLRYNKESIKRRLKMLNPDFNVVKAYLKPLESLGIKGDYRPKIILEKEEIEKLKKILPNNFIAVGVGARYKNKIYPYFKEFINLIKDENVVLVGSKEDKDLFEINQKNVIDLRGKLTIRESLAVISLAKGVVSNDSAIAHFARAVKTPVLVIYGATHPYLGFAPFKDEGDFIFKGLECQPCDLHGKGSCKRGDLACLDIKPEFVLERFNNMLKERLS